MGLKRCIANSIVFDVFHQKMIPNGTLVPNKAFGMVYRHGLTIIVIQIRSNLKRIDGLGKGFI